MEDPYAPCQHFTAIKCCIALLEFLLQGSASLNTDMTPPRLPESDEAFAFLRTGTAHKLTKLIAMTQKPKANRTVNDEFVKRAIIGTAPEAPPAMQVYLQMPSTIIRSSLKG